MNQKCLQYGINKQITFEEIKKELVLDFPHSKTRSKNFDGLVNYLEELHNSKYGACITKLWLDGSFVSDKEDPEDIDMVFFLDATNTESGIIVSNENYFRVAGEKHNCDTYYLLDYETIPTQYVDDRSQLEAQKKYWMGQFCFDRDENVKSIVEMKIGDFIK